MQSVVLALLCGVSLLVSALRWLQLRTSFPCSLEGVDPACPRSERMSDCLTSGWRGEDGEGRVRCGVGRGVEVVKERVEASSHEIAPHPGSGETIGCRRSPRLCL